MNKYTEAIQGDDVVILCDGIPMGVGEILAALNAATPPADAALADALEAASNRCHGQDVAALRKAAAALRARPQAVAEGFVMVLVEPTGEMLAAGAYLAGQRNYEDSEIRNIYQDMLAASQSATGGAT